MVTSVQIQMPSAPPYAPVQSPPWIDDLPPAPPGPPAPPPPAAPPPRRRGRATAIVVALSLLCGGIGLELGGALFGSPTAHRSTAATPTGDTATLPTVGSTTPATGGANGSNGSTAADIAASVDPAIVDITTTLSNGAAAGTGLVLTSSGLVLTNNHVIADATAIRAQINGSGPSYSATVLGYDVTEDVALLQLDGVSNLTTITVGDSSKIAVHDKVVALGNALGRGGTPAVAEGTVTALDQTITAGDIGGGPPAQTLNGLIEFSAPLVPGDSGGALVNSSGQVIGMNAAASQSNGRRRNSNDAFAIPINAALDIAHQIQAGQSSAKVHVGARALLGVQIQQAQTATVAAVQSGSPADSAGIVAGDVIVAIGDTTVGSVSDITSALDSRHPGDKVSVGWLDTNGQRHTATVQLIEGPPA